LSPGHHSSRSRAGPGVFWAQHCLALHPLPTISPKISQKMIIPSWRSIKGRCPPHSSLVANQDSRKPHFSFYFFIALFLFLSWEVAVSHESLPQKDLSSLLRASERLHHRHPPPSLPMGTARCPRDRR